MLNECFPKITCKSFSCEKEIHSHSVHQEMAAALTLHLRYSAAENNYLLPLDWLQNCNWPLLPLHGFICSMNNCLAIFDEGTRGL